MASVNFLVSDDTALEELRRVTGRETKAEVVRDALSLYQFLAKRLQQGDHIYVGKDPEDVVELDVSTLRSLKKDP